MKLYIYHGLDDEKVPKDVTHAIVDDSVTVIKKSAFDERVHLVSIILGANVKRIEEYAFSWCVALRVIRLSKTLEYIENFAFCGCESLEALFLPSTVNSIKHGALRYCWSLRLLVLPHGIDLSNVGNDMINRTKMHQIAEDAGVAIDFDDSDGIDDYLYTAETNLKVNKWLIHHMDIVPFHKLCYTTSITAKAVNNYLNANGKDSGLTIDAIHGMTPLHILAMNPHAPADAIAALLDVNVEAAFCVDNTGKTSLEYARDYNVDGLVGMINVLCNHRFAV